MKAISSKKILDFFLIILAIFLLLFLSFAVSNSFVEGEQTVKTFLFLYATAGIAGLSGFYLLFKKDKMSISIAPTDVGLTILLSYIIANRYLLHGSFGFSIRFFELIGLTVFYWLIRLSDKKWHLLFFLALVTAGLLQGLYGNLQLYGFYPSNHARFVTTGSFFNPGPFAGFLAGIFPIALGIYFFRNELNLSTLFFRHPTPLQCAIIRSVFIIITVAASFFVLLILPASQSRAALLAVGAGTAYICFFRYDVQRKLSGWLDSRFKKIVSTTLVLAIIAGSLAGLYWVKKDSADGRIFIWQVTAQMIYSQPVTGVGYDRFEAEYLEAQAQWFQAHPNSSFEKLAGNTKYAFNEPLQFVAEEGLAGLLILLILEVLIMGMPLQSDNRLLLAKAGIMTIATFSLFSYPSDILPIKMVFVVYLAVTASFQKPILGLDFSMKLAREKWLKGVAVVILTAGTILGVMFINRWWEASKTWKSGVELYYAKNMDESIKLYKSVYPFFEKKGDFLMNYGKALSMAERDSVAVNVLRKAEKYYNNLIVQTALGDSYKRLGKFKKAEQAYLLASKMLPDRFYPNYLLAKLYDTSGQQHKAVSLARQLVSKKPKVPSTAVEEIKLEMKNLLKKYN